MLRSPLFVLLSAVSLAAQKPEEFVISGRVLDQSGEGVVAKVQLRWRARPELPGIIGLSFGDHGSRSMLVSTDSSGRFRIRVSHRGPYVISASAKGLRSAEHFPAMAKDVFELRLAKPPRVVGQLVRAEDESAVSGVGLRLMPERMTWLRLRMYRWPEPRGEGKSDAKGRFELAGRVIKSPRPLWPDFKPFDVVPYSLSPDLVVVDAKPLPAGESWKGYRVAVGHAVSPGVRIEDAHGKPFEGRAVIDRWSGRVVARIGAKGRIHARFPPLGYVEVNQPGYEWRRISRKSRIIVMNRSRTLRATLLGVDRKPLARAKVLWTIDRVPPAPEWLKKTDKDGRITFDQALRIGALTGYVEVDGKFVRFYRGRQRKMEKDVGEVVVDGSRTLRGLVFGAGGGPAPYARVALFSENREVTDAPVITYADRSGRFTFDALPRGAHLVVVEAGDAGMHAIDVGEGTKNVVVQIPRGICVEGIVRNAANQPVAGAQVVLQRRREVTLQSRCMPGPHRSLTSLSSVTDGKGRFRFRGLPTGNEWTIRCRVVVVDRGNVLEGTQTASGEGERGVIVRVLPVAVTRRRR